MIHFISEPHNDSVMHIIPVPASSFAMFGSYVIGGSLQGSRVPLVASWFETTYQPHLIEPIFTINPT
jgi:hypothetical protein